MKLESTLSDRAGMLYTAPLTDVILLLIIFFLFGSNLVLKSGVEVHLPVSGSVIPLAEDAHIITLIAGESEDFYLNDNRVDLLELGERLEDLAKRSREVVILGDEAVPYGEVMKISNLLLEDGFQVSFATQKEQL